MNISFNNITVRLFLDLASEGFTADKFGFS
jgi:hypothetical protein